MLDTLTREAATLADRAELGARRRLHAFWLRQRWVWWLPFLVFCTVVLNPPGRLELGAAALVALGGFVWALKQPTRALLVLIAFLAFQVVGLALLWRSGLPGSLARSLGAVKEVLSFALLAVAVHRIRAEGRRLDGLDRLLLAFVAVVLLQLFLPYTARLPALPFGVRLAGARLNLGFPLLLFAVRHAPLDPDVGRRAVRVVAAVTVVLGMGAAWARFDGEGFARWLIESARLYDFRTQVMGLDPMASINAFRYTLESPSRATSFLLSPFDLAQWMLLPFGVGLERLARGVAPRSSAALVAVSGFSIFATGTRASILAAGVVVLLALRPSAHRPEGARLAVWSGVLVAALVLVPALGSSRFVDDEAAADSSDQHIEEIRGGLTILRLAPTGLGLGYNPATGDRYVFGSEGTGSVTTDNSLLQVGIEMGVGPMVLFGALLVAILAQLTARATRSADPLVGGVRLAFIGLLLSGLVHHVFLAIPPTWTVWAFLGLALRADPADRPPDPAATHPEGASAPAPPGRTSPAWS